MENDYTPYLKSNRITSKSLTRMVDELFIKLEVPFKVDSITVTRFTSDQYECGAVKQIFNCSSPEYSDINVYCFYSKKEIEDCLRLGYRLTYKEQSAKQNRHHDEIDLIK